MKYHIEKNTIQETLVIPLYARKMCSELFPSLFRDETAIRLIDKIDSSGGTIFFAAGVFYYFLNEQVKKLVRAMSEAFPGGRLVFDAANKSAVKLMLKTWIKDAEIQDVGAYFAVSDAVREISQWSHVIQVSSRGYMLGYNDLRDPSVSGFFRFLAKVGDGVMKMRIVRVEFGDGN